MDSNSVYPTMLHIIEHTGILTDRQGISMFAQLKHLLNLHDDIDDRIYVIELKRNAHNQPYRHCAARALLQVRACALSVRVQSVLRQSQLYIDLQCPDRVAAWNAFITRLCVFDAAFEDAKVQCACDADNALQMMIDLRAVATDHTVRRAELIAKFE